MSNLTENPTAVVLLLLAIGGSLSAQTDKGTTGSRDETFRPETVETIRGEVIRVEHSEVGQRAWRGVHLVLKTDKEEIAVHLGPEWHLEDQGVKLGSGDRVQVKGSRVKVQGKPAIIASEIKKGDTTFIFRDEDGVPVWSRGPGRS